MPVLAATCSKNASPRRDRGKRGSFRTLVAFKSGQMSIFVFGFAKYEKDNIDDRERRALKKLANELLDYDDNTIGIAVRAKALRKLRYEDG